MMAILVIRGRQDPQVNRARRDCKESKDILVSLEVPVEEANLVHRVQWAYPDQWGYKAAEGHRGRAVQWDSEVRQDQWDRWDQLVKIQVHKRLSQSVWRS